MKSSIEELARKCGLIGHIWRNGAYDEEKVSKREIKFANAIFELAAKECENVLAYNEDDPSETYAEAIRKLKV